MSVVVDDDIVRLEGDCHVEDAEALFAALHERAGRTVEVSGCRRLHAAVAQVLVVFAPPIAGEPQDDFLRRYVFTNVGANPIESED